LHATQKHHLPERNSLGGVPLPCCALEFFDAAILAISLDLLDAFPRPALRFAHLAADLSVLFMSGF
jgi:hypothetical protein